MDGTRLDKWLWAARFFKTRSQAADAVEGGKVRLAGARVKPAQALKIGSMLDVDNGSTRWEIEVMALSDKRGPASVAQGLYRETAESIAARAKLADERRYFSEPSAAFKGRPTKRDRRLLDDV